MTAPSAPGRLVGRARRIARNLRATLALALEAAPRNFAFMLSLTVLSGVVPPVTLFFTKHVIDGIAAGPSSWRDHIVLLPVIGLGAMAVVNKVIGALTNRSNDLFADRVWMTAHKKFIAHVAAADLALLDDPSWHDRLTRAKADVGWRPHSMTMTMVHICSSSVTVLALLSALAYLDPPLLVLGVVSVLPSTFVQLRVNQRYYDLFWRTTRREREHDYMVHIASSTYSAKEIRAFQLGEHVVGRARRLSEHRLEQKRALYRDATMMDLFGALGSAAILVCAYFIIADSATQGRLTIGDVAAIFGAFTSLTAHLGATLAALAQMDQHAQFLDDYFAFLAIEPRVKAPPNPKPLPARIERVALERVSFSYPAQSEAAITDVDLEVRAGEIVALVGENGAGKSTLVKLLLRFFDPTQGSVRFNDIDARDCDPKELRARVGVLFQDFTAFELEVRDVVGFGRVERPFDVGRADAALKAARAQEIVTSLGAGFDSVVGRVLEGGHDLSGGQWQRLALARLIYRDADLWILDEPTANLDPEAEAAVFEELRALLRGRMGIVISHRFSTVRTADRIFVLEHGRVIEQGDHRALMNHGGRYADMFTKQASGYR